MGTIGPDLIGGAMIAFAAAAVAVWLDVRDTMKMQLGSSNTMAGLLIRKGWWFLLIWGVFDASLYVMILNNPGWARSTFGFDLDENKLLAGAAVGLSAVFVIRSKLAKVGNVEVGGEWAYTWSRAYLLSAVSQEWGIRRIQILKDYEPVTKDVANRPKFFPDLEKWLLQQAKATPDDKDFVLAQIALIKKQANASDPTKDPGIDPGARSDLLALGVDFLGPKNIDLWAKTTGYR